MTDCNVYQKVWGCIPPNLNVKTKKPYHQVSQAGDQRYHRWGVGGQRGGWRKGDGSKEEGFVVCNPPLSLLLFITSSSLWLSASLPCTARSNLSRRQVRQADDETSPCMRGWREGGGGGGGGGRNGGKETECFKTRLTPPCCNQNLNRLLA